MTPVHESNDLTARTLRTVAVLVGACVLFVGALSLTAVTVANRAVGGPAGHTTETSEVPTPTKAPGRSSSQSI